MRSLPIHSLLCCDVEDNINIHFLDWILVMSWQYLMSDWVLKGFVSYSEDREGICCNSPLFSVGLSLLLFLFSCLHMPRPCWNIFHSFLMSFRGVVGGTTTSTHKTVMCIGGDEQQADSSVLEPFLCQIAQAPSHCPDSFHTWPRRRVIQPCAYSFSQIGGN